MMKRARPLSNAHARLSGLLLVLLLGGCSWFTWLPWVDGKEDEDNDEPAPLVQFDEEVKVQRLWRSSVGDGLGRKYLRLSPVVDENLVLFAIIPTTINRLQFTADQVTLEKVGVQVTGLAVYRIVEPEITFHGLRHTYASDLVRQGVPQPVKHELPR